MNGVMATLQRELRAFFVAPLAYIVAGVLLVGNGLVFSFIVTLLNSPEFGGQIAPLQLFFGGVFFWFFMFGMVPILTMRLLSEERRSGTIESLMTAPVSEAQVVLGKFLAALTFFAFLWLPTVIYGLILEIYQDVDWGPILAGYVGVLGVGSLFLSVGVFASAVARSQLVAAAVTLAIIVPLGLLGIGDALMTSEGGRAALAHMSLLQHMQDFSRGLVDTSHLVYYLSATIFFLFLATTALATRKWQ